MGEKAEYRSAVRSRRLIREAFLSILQEGGSAKMTVTEIVRRADINRATFYAHYPDVQGVIDEIENEVVDKVFDVLQQSAHGNFFNDLPSLFQNINSYIHDNIDSFRILVKANEALPFMEKMKTLFVDFLRDYSGIPESVRNDERFRLRCIYYVGGLMSIYKEWLLGNLSCSIEMIAAQCEELLGYFALSFIGSE